MKSSTSNYHHHLNSHNRKNTNQTVETKENEDIRSVMDCPLSFIYGNPLDEVDDLNKDLLTEDFTEVDDYNETFDEKQSKDKA